MPVFFEGPNMNIATGTLRRAARVKAVMTGKMRTGEPKCTLRWFSHGKQLLDQTNNWTSG